MIKNKKKKKY